MEAVAAVASIAGLLGLAGQCINGLTNLRNLYQNIEDASQTVSLFVRDVNSLLRAVTDIKDLLERLQARGLEDFEKGTCTSLALHLKECDEDTRRWLAQAQSSRTTLGDAGGRAMKTWFRKFWIAANEKAIKNVRADMLARRAELSVAMSILGRTMDLGLVQTTTSVALELRATHH